MLNKEFIIKCKVYIDRARMYIGYVQFVVLIFIFLNSFKEKHFVKYFTASPLSTAIVGIAVFLLSCLLIGWIDYKIGFFEEEQKRHSTLNPVINDILKKLENIEKLLEKESVEK